MKVHASGTFFDARVSVLTAARQCGRSRPLFTYVDGIVWVPSPQEHQPCCDALVERKYNVTHTLYKHCCSRKHIANLVASRYEQNYYPEYEGKEGENTIYSYSPTGDVTLSIHP